MPVFAEVRSGEWSIFMVGKDDTALKKDAAKLVGENKPCSVITLTEDHVRSLSLKDVDKGISAIRDRGLSSFVLSSNGD